jgi:hypothetical protein
LEPAAHVEGVQEVSDPFDGAGNLEERRGSKELRRLRKCQISAFFITRIPSSSHAEHDDEMHIFTFLSDLLLLG